MKKVVSLLTLTLLIALLPLNSFAGADTTSADQAKTEQVDSSTAAAEPAPANEKKEELKKEDSPEPTFTEVMKETFLDGGVEFMTIVLICLILGVAISIERIIYLSLATVNTDKLLLNVEEALNSGGVEAAKEVCRNTRGPVGSIFYEGLLRADEGPAEVEKSIIAGGSVQMGLLEKGVSWISLFIALAPMLGFMGTVIGMIGAFKAIVEQGGIKATTVAGGIQVALITTVAGLVVAIILQIFYNFIIAKIENLVNSMEDASNSFVRIVSKHIKGQGSSQEA